MEAGSEVLDKAVAGFPGFIGFIYEQLVALGSRIYPEYPFIAASAIVLVAWYLFEDLILRNLKVVGVGALGVYVLYTMGVI